MAKRERGVLYLVESEACCHDAHAVLIEQLLHYVPVELQERLVPCKHSVRGLSACTAAYHGRVIRCYSGFGGSGGTGKRAEETSDE